jgi:hypothetical protein
MLYQQSLAAELDVMKAVFAQQEDKTLQLGPTMLGRALLAAERFVFVFAAVVVIGGLFFAVDYIGRLRDEEPFAGFLFLVLAATAAVVALIAALVRFVRTELWVVEPAEGMLLYQTSLVWGRGIDQTGVELDQIACFRVESKGFAGAGALYVELEGGERERIFEGWLAAKSLESAAERLDAFLTEHDYDITVERAPR